MQSGAQPLPAVPLLKAWLGKWNDEGVNNRVNFAAEFIKKIEHS